MEGKAEEAALATGLDPLREVHEVAIPERPVRVDHPNAAASLVHEEPSAAIARIGDADGVNQSGNDRLQLDPGQWRHAGRD
jgi:hypothetical protein